MALAEGIRNRLASVFKRSGQKLDELTGEDRQEFLRAAANMGDRRLHGYHLFEEYYDGEHRIRLLERARRYLEASGLKYTENFCETIVDVMVQRLEVVGFQVEENEDASDWLTKTVWPHNGMDEKQGIIHTQTTIKGDGFVIVTYDETTGLPKYTWNRPEIIKPVYADDDPDEMLYAAKVWTTAVVSPTNPTGMVINRLNVYFPNRVEKWFCVGDRSGQEMWAPHLDVEDIGENGVALWPIPWTLDGTLDGEPIGIPVVHFRNKPKGRTFGRSELKGVIPQQDALTKQLMDLFYVMDAQGWKQRWAAGIPDDVTLNIAVGEWIKSANENAKFGEFDAEDPGPMGAAIEGQIRRMAARSQTPLHQMLTGGTLPSGESLKTAESGLIHKTGDRKTTHGGAYARMQRLGVRVVEVFGQLPGDVTIEPDAEIVTLWADSESRNEQAETETFGVQVELLGLSKTTALRKLGYDPDEEAKLRAQEQAEEPEPPEPPEPPGNPPVPPAPPAE